MNNKNKRILWLINHTTLREFEVPLLVSLGYEVYTPKCIPDFIYEWSGSIDHSFDSTLTIPTDALAILNQHDFYENPMTQEVESLINQYFSAAFCVFYPKLLEEIVRYFNGKILLRAFGLDKSISYGSVINAALGKDFLTRLQLIGERFWFSQSYPNLAEIEPPLLRMRSVDHPLGLSDDFFKHTDKWVGGVNKILFFCSRIKASPTYYGKIYDVFKKQFGDLPHLIAGNQPIDVDDEHVAGRQSRETIDEWLRTYNVMFYHSDEPRHLHYHPLEALVFGMPLIFMQEGMLGQLSGGNQPGACATFAEAKQKIKRILAGDQVFIQEIREKQRAMLRSFTLDYNRLVWQKNFVQKIMDVPTVFVPQLKKPIKTIGVFLPEAYRGGSLNGAKNIAKMLHLGSRQANEPVQVIFSCVASYYDIDKDFADLTELGITVQETSWKVVDKDSVMRAQRLSNHHPPLHYPCYAMPVNGVGNFAECDYWFFVSDRLIEPLAPIKPYGILVYDFIQRYVPGVFSNHFSDASFINTTRGANFVLTTTPQTREDVIQYAGVPEHRVHLSPLEFDPLQCKKSMIDLDKNYFIWATNIAVHKNQARALEALNIYYSELNGLLDVVMTGTHVEAFNLENSEEELGEWATLPNVKKVRALLSRFPKVSQRLHIKGNLATSDYVAFLSAAKFIWHPALFDNGTYAVLEAAYYNVPALSTSYPQMHYMNERFKLNMEFCNPFQARDMAMQLKKMELEYGVKRLLLPSKEELNQFTYDKLAPEFWSLVRRVL